MIIGLAIFLIVITALIQILDFWRENNKKFPQKIRRGLRLAGSILIVISGIILIILTISEQKEKANLLKKVESLDSKAREGLRLQAYSAFTLGVSGPQYLEIQNKAYLLRKQQEKSQTSVTEWLDLELLEAFHDKIRNKIYNLHAALGVQFQDWSLEEYEKYVKETEAKGKMTVLDKGLIGTFYYEEIVKEQLAYSKGANMANWFRLGFWSTAPCCMPNLSSNSLLMLQLLEKELKLPDILVTSCLMELIQSIEKCVTYIKEQYPSYGMPTIIMDSQKNHSFVSLINEVKEKTDTFQNKVSNYILNELYRSSK